MTPTFTSTVDHDQGLATITLSRPDIGNKLTGGDLVALAGAIEAAGADDRVKVIAVRAQGDTFCAGRDPGKKPDTPPTALELRDRVTQPIMNLYAAVRGAQVPVLCIVQGDARGFGCAFAGQCDITIASSSARFSLPELDVNLPPTLAISALLRKAPPKAIARLVYSREDISAADAYAFGIVSQVVEPGDLSKTADDLVAKMVSRPRTALATVKEYLWTALETDSRASARLAENMISVAMSAR